MLLGSGEKLLHLLRKFSVENVLLAIGLRLAHPYQNFLPSNFYFIIDKGKELLNTLYDKVLESEISKRITEEESKLNRSVKARIRTDGKAPLKVHNQAISFPGFGPRPAQIDRENNRPSYIFSGKAGPRKPNKISTREEL